jgi:hypothetical protein
MSRRTAAWVAWSVCALSLMLTALSLLLLVLNLSHSDVPIHPYWTVNTLIAIGFAPVGAVIVPRSSPRNPIGWLFGGIGLLWAVMHFSAQYAIYTALAVPGSFPSSKAAVWMMCWVWVPASGLIVFLCLRPVRAVDLFRAQQRPEMLHAVPQGYGLRCWWSGTLQGWHYVVAHELPPLVRHRAPDWNSCAQDNKTQGERIPQRVIFVLNVVRESSQNAVKAKFAECFFHALG